MDIEIKQVGDVMVAKLAGEINGATTPELQEQLLPLIQPGCKVVLDLHDVTYMSSAGLRTLLLLYRQIDNENGAVVLTGLSEVLRDTMSITGFLDFFQSYDRVEEGIAAVGSDYAAG